MIRKYILILSLLVSPVWASVSFTSLTAGGSTSATSPFSTAIVTPTANNVVLMTIAGRLGASNGPGAIGGVASTGMTWTNWDGITYGGTVGSGKNNRLELWCGVGASPSASAITITWATNPTGVTWGVDQSSGAASTCAGAKGNIFHNSQDTATASPLTVTMTSFLNGSSATYAGGTVDHSGSAVGQGASFTELSPQTTNAPSSETEFAVGHVSPATITYGGGTAVWAISGAEVLPPGGTPTLASPFVIAP